MRKEKERAREQENESEKSSVGWYFISDPKCGHQVLQAHIFRVLFTSRPMIQLNDQIVHIYCYHSLPVILGQRSILSEIALLSGHSKSTEYTDSVINVQVSSIN